GNVDTVGAVAVDCSGNVDTVGAVVVDCSGNVDTVGAVAVDCSGNVDTVGAVVVDCSGNVDTVGAVVVDCSDNVDTVGAVAVDCSGNVDTVGAVVKMVGRAGDSPIINNLSGALSFIGHEESILKVTPGRLVLFHVEQGNVSLIGTARLGGTECLEALGNWRTNRSSTDTRDKLMYNCMSGSYFYLTKLYLT
uniref:Uncharacterized protein n=1 Tax=Oncorhynchus mykiss TaxID=8022 RepID=A0A8K9X4C9_ONCMY